MMGITEISHPTSELFPLMDETELAELAKDIQENGQREPIWLLGDEILDGRNRYLACQRLGLQPKIRNYTGKDPVSFVISLNLHRRHLNESQRAAVAVKLKKLYAGEAKQRQVEHGHTAPGRGKTLSANLREVNEQPRKASQDAAKKLNVSPRLVEDASLIEREAPELIPQIEKGGVDGSWC
jgi:hypothetical protein